MLREQRVDIRFRSSLVSLLFAIVLMATPFQSWDWYCYGYCDVWMCGIVVEGIFTQQCDTICSYDLYNDYCWVYLE